MLSIEVAAMKNKGQKITEAKEKELFDKIKNRYDEQTKPQYAAARLWLDAIIDPADTRKVLAEGIAAANNAPADHRYNVGVLQT